jgi:hypothetical protein
MGSGSFPGVKCGRGVLLTTHPPSSAAVMEEYSYTTTHPLGQTGPVTRTLYLYIHIKITFQFLLTLSLLRTRLSALEDHKFLLLLILKRHASERNILPNLNSKHPRSFINAKYVLVTIT